jgi:hypothetical protein
VRDRGLSLASLVAIARRAGERGWVDAAFSGTFLTLMGVFCWPHWHRADDASPVLTGVEWALPVLIPALAVGGEGWGRRMRIGFLLVWMILWIGGMRRHVIYAPGAESTDQVIGMLLMSVVMAWTLWSRARDREPGPPFV